jgi:hypothetical protein
MPPAPSGLPGPSEPPDRGAVARRDAGLRRVSRLTRWLLAGALTLTAAFSAIAARTLPGQSTSSTSTSQSGQTSQTSSSDSNSSSGSDQGDDGAGTLQSPASTPSASSGSGSVTSGGS